MTNELQAGPLSGLQARREMPWATEKEAILAKSYLSRPEADRSLALASGQIMDSLHTAIPG